MESMKRVKEIICIIFTILGISMVILPFLGGMNAVINGYSSSLLCLDDCELIYGLKAFLDYVLFYSWICWPSYIIGVITLIYLFKMISSNFSGWKKYFLLIPIIFLMLWLMMLVLILCYKIV